MHSSTLSLIAVLDGGGGWPTPHPGRFTPGKETRYPMCSRLGGPQGQSGRVRKIFPSPGFDPRTVRLLASRYNGHFLKYNNCNKVYKSTRLNFKG